VQPVAKATSGALRLQAREDAIGTVWMEDEGNFRARHAVLRNPFRPKTDESLWYGTEQGFTPSRQ